MANKKEKAADDAGLETTAADTESVENEDNNTQPEEKEASLQEQLSEALKKADDNWNLFLSARAEADNIQKRAQRDVSNAHKYALEKFIPELLGVKDSLELGAKAARESAEADNEQLEKFLQGSDMTINLFNDVLAKVGVVMINPEGELFNPEQHQAMTMLPNPDLPANTVIEVVQKGYMLNERLIRPAMVIVSKP